MRRVAAKTWPEGYAFHPFLVKTTDLEFGYSRRSANVASQKGGSRGSNISAVWTPRLQETLISGVLQGRKQTDAKGASALSRNRMRELLVETVVKLEKPTLQNLPTSSSYVEWKQSAHLAVRRQVKKAAKHEVLKGWDTGIHRITEGQDGTIS